MLEALLFGVVASGALVIGGTVGALWHAPTWLTGVLLAFASGSLISALCFELFPEADHLGGTTRAGIRLVAGAAVFVAVNTLLDKYVAKTEPDPQADQREVVRDAASGGVGFALLAAVTLDGIPENAALGVSLVEESSLALLLAIFASNLPESLVGAVEMREGGRSPRFAIMLWLVTAVLLAAAVVLGRAALGGADDETLSFLLAFAGGAVLASLADTVMPEAFVKGKPVNAFSTGGFLRLVPAGVLIRAYT
ncbi:MAG: ZIP family metal transporter [Gaiellaceae bacterium]